MIVKSHIDATSEVAVRQETVRQVLSLNRVLFGFGAALVLIDTIWVLAGHFAIDAHNYLLLGCLILPLTAGAAFYSRSRIDPALSAMLAGAAFLLAFSASCSLLSYLLVTVAGSRIDNLLASADMSIGFYWPSVMTFAANHPLLTSLLGMAYLSVMFQIAMLLLLLGWMQRCADLYGLCLSIAIGGIITLSIWAVHPSFGAFSVFDLPPDTAAKLGLALDGNYGRDLVAMLRHGPGFISPSEMRGIVGFPSYHTVQALMLIWYSRTLPVLRWITLALNVAVLIATPIHGGHHLIDLFGGFAVAAASVAVTRWLLRSTAQRAVKIEQLIPLAA